MRKVPKNLSLSIEVVEELELEDNQSELVEKLLRDYYGLD
jgi:hypothetical protein